MAIKVNGATVVTNSRRGVFRAVNPGSYTTDNRPSGASEGDVIYDTDEKTIFVWNGTEWIAAGGASADGPSIGNGTIVGPVVTSPTKGGLVDNPYSITLESGYSADAADPYEKTILLISANEEFTDLKWGYVSTDPNETTFLVTAPVEANQDLWLRVSYISTSGNRSEFGVKYKGVANPTELETFVETFYQEDYQSTNVTVSTIFANRNDIEVIVYLASGQPGQASGNGGTGQYAAGGSGGQGGDANVNIVKLTADELGWTSGQSFTFSADKNNSIYSNGYKLIAGGGGGGYDMGDGSDLSLVSSPSDSTASNIADAITELNTYQPFYTVSAGTGGSGGSKGTTNHEGEGKPGFGGGGGGGGLVMNLTNANGTGYYPEGSDIQSTPPDVSGETANNGSNGNGVSKNDGKYASGGTAGLAGAGWGAGGGGGGGPAQATNNNWSSASSVPGGSADPQMIVVVKGTKVPASFLAAGYGTTTFSF